MSRFGRWYAKTYKNVPYIMAFGTCFVKGSLADGVTQTKIEEPRNGARKFNMKRNVRFATWSGAYCGGVQHFVYNVLYSRLFPGTHLAHRVSATLVDTAIHGPMIYLPTYYISKSYLTGGTATDGLNEYSGNLRDIVISYWKVWCPTVLVTMTIMPMEFRILFISGVSLFWLMLLSYKAPMVDHAADPDLDEYRVTEPLDIDEGKSDDSRDIDVVPSENVHLQHTH